MSGPKRRKKRRRKQKKSEPDRKTTSFYIEKSLIAELDDAWYALLGEGIRIDRVDFREAIVRWGWTTSTNFGPSTTGRSEEADA